jgi:hypothetical protein
MTDWSACKFNFDFLRSKSHRFSMWRRCSLERSTVLVNFRHSILFINLKFKLKSTLYKKIQPFWRLSSSPLFIKHYLFTNVHDVNQFCISTFKWKSAHYQKNLEGRVFHSVHENSYINVEYSQQTKFSIDI